MTIPWVAHCFSFSLEKGAGHHPTIPSWGALGQRVNTIVLSWLRAHTLWSCHLGLCPSSAAYQWSKWLKTAESCFLTFKIRANTKVIPQGHWRGFNEIMNRKCLSQCLAYSKCLINNSSLSLLLSGWPEGSFGFLHTILLLLSQRNKV